MKIVLIDRYLDGFPPRLTTTKIMETNFSIRGNEWDRKLWSRVVHGRTPLCVVPVGRGWKRRGIDCFIWLLFFFCCWNGEIILFETEGGDAFISRLFSFRWLVNMSTEWLACVTFTRRILPRASLEWQPEKMLVLLGLCYSPPSSLRIYTRNRYEILSPSLQLPGNNWPSQNP